jgi:hypothetical protein
MRVTTGKLVALASLGVACILATLRPSPLSAQAPWPFPSQTTPDAQRNAINGVRSQVNWLLNATRTASSYGPEGCGKIWQEFQTLRGAYSVFKSTLTPAQLQYGANDLAEIEAGLDILQEAFAYHQADLAAGRSPASALRNLCQVLARGSRVWVQELNRVSTRLRVGWS